MQNGKEKKTKTVKPKMVPMWRLFSYSDRWDILLLILGTLGAILKGKVRVFFLKF